MGVFTRLADLVADLVADFSLACFAFTLIASFDVVATSFIVCEVFRAGSFFGADRFFGADDAVACLLAATAFAVVFTGRVTLVAVKGLALVGLAVDILAALGFTLGFTLGLVAVVCNVLLALERLPRRDFAGLESDTCEACPALTWAVRTWAAGVFATVVALRVFVTIPFAGAGILAVVLAGSVLGFTLDFILDAALVFSWGFVLGDTLVEAFANFVDFEGGCFAVLDFLPIFFAAVA